MNDDLSPAAILGETGPFAQKIPGFSPRQEQQDMSVAVAAAIENMDTLVVEAGTGVGKTYAYLVPALLSGGKIIMSTGTRHLQDQLYHRDLPIVLKTLGMNLNKALLKGRSNYLCLQRLQLSEGTIRDREQISELQTVKSWARKTKSGDIAELESIAEDSPIWPKVTSTIDNCLGSECPQFNECYVVKSRRQAQEADVVVVNHYLFFADMALKEEGFGEILPSANTFIFDEAHQLPEIATRFFGKTISTRQMQDLANDITAAQLKEASDLVELRNLAADISNASRAMRLAFGDKEQRAAWEVIKHNKSIKEAFTNLIESLESVHDILDTAKTRGEELNNCFERSSHFLSQLKSFTDKPREDDANDAYSGKDVMQWYETYRTAFSLHTSPLDIAYIFNQHMSSFHASWIFTSATLSVNGVFDHFTHRMGLEDPVLLLRDSPFDYQNNALLYLPEELPDPNAPDYTAEVVRAALPVLRASRGRAFILFTSHRALRIAANILSDFTEFSLLIQGDMPRSQLLDKFREVEAGVLLGTSSFWEGVDIKGEALSCIIIDKLPFASPDDPLLQARLNRIREQGGNPFFDYQLPQAAIVLKQGVGRLIRDVNDRGVLMICDPRLKTKPYGKIFIGSIPVMPITRKIVDIENFFAAESQQYKNHA